MSPQTSWLKMGNLLFSADGNEARRRLLYLSIEYDWNFLWSPLSGTANAKNSFCKKLAKWFAQTMCRESHVLDMLQTIYIFDLQRGLDHNYISNYNLVKNFMQKRFTVGGPGQGQDDACWILFHQITRIWLFRGKVQGGQGQDAGHQVCGGRRWCCR